jgi:MoxR-like ATPase
VKEWVRWGAGPRAGQAMILTAKARALLRGNFSVTLDDIRNVAFPVLRHRILMNFKAEAESVTPDDVIEKLIELISKRANVI